ncbi:hypothetical protein [Sphingomonas sp. ID0503]|uniref:hypothetical protein n=1 Tax=Sphingomonas sp. ID0503 TaxID=3399691 RepID=UPI003AFB1646
MNPFEMVVLIVAIVAIANVFRAKYGVIRRGKGEEFRNPSTDAENRQLREELRTLKERVATLERIATDDSTALDREIERLRDR